MVVYKSLKFDLIESNKLSSSLADMFNKLEKKGNETESGEMRLLDKIGLIGAKRLRQEFLDDQNEKKASANFDKIRILTEKYHTCKDKRKKQLIITLILNHNHLSATLFLWNLGIFTIIFFIIYWII